MSLLINTVVLLNFIIAILADTYSKLSSQSLGIYYDGIIARIPVYEDDSRYGGLILATPPFNLLAFLIAPYYAFATDERRLKYVNDIFVKVTFVPYALVFSAIFIVCNLVLLPIAYLAALLKKLKLMCRRQETSELD